MSKHWKKKLKYKNMEQIKNEEIEKKIIMEKVESGEKIEPKTFQVKSYKTRFGKIRGYRLQEESTIHCANGDKLTGHEGDFYVCLDAISELVLPSDIFRKLFIIDLEKND